MADGSRWPPRRFTQRTEVGKLGLALNGMLGQIESAATVREASLAELEASERKLRRFVADASHELRTPLAAVRASALVLLGDRDRLRQAVDNLLANVRAHTPSGSPAWVTLDAVERMARLEVADSGPGLETEQREHVFERFYRADQSRSRASGGAGLGLSIVAAVSEAHGGNVAVESSPEKGTTFRIELPLA